MGDLLLWVGREYYRTPDHFAEEAAQYGVSRRTGLLPSGARLGDRVWLAHKAAGVKSLPLAAHDPLQLDTLREAFEVLLEAEGEKRSPLWRREPPADADERLEYDYADALYRRRVWKQVAAGQPCNAKATCGGRARPWKVENGVPVELIDAPGIFGYFVMAGLEAIVSGASRVADLARLRNGIVPRIVSTAELRTEAERGCGVREPGGVYIVARVEPEDFERLWKAMEEAGLAQTFGLSGPLWTLARPYLFDVGHANIPHFMGVAELKKFGLEAADLVGVGVDATLWTAADAVFLKGRSIRPQAKETEAETGRWV